MYQYRTPMGPAEVPPPEDEYQEDFCDSGPHEECRGPRAKDSAKRSFPVLTTIFFLLMGGYLVWDLIATEKVTASRPIGEVMALSGTGNWAWPLVVETPQGYFPLINQVSISKGTPLVLEDRASGDHYICDVQRTRCVRTSSRTIPAAKAAGS